LSAALLLRRPLNPLQNFAQELEIISGRSNGLFLPCLQPIFAFVPLSALDQLFVWHDALFQFANSRPKRAFERFGILFAQAFRQKIVKAAQLSKGEDTVWQYADSLHVG